MVLATSNFMIIDNLKFQNFLARDHAPGPGLKVNDQLVAYATRFLAVRLKILAWSHHCTLKAKVQCDFSSAYSPYHTNILRLININSNIDQHSKLIFSISRLLATFIFKMVTNGKFCYGGHSARRS